jgi:rhodanese-related sulfurtransferase
LPGRLEASGRAYRIVLRNRKNRRYDLRMFARLFVMLFPVSLFFCLAWPALGASDEVPRITVESLKKMMDEKADVLIIDVQPRRVYEKGHIKGAVSLPWTPKLTEAQAAALPRHKPAVVYCDCGPGEADSASVGARLIELGFGDVRVLADPSIRGWKQAGYPME